MMYLRRSIAIISLTILGLTAGVLVRDAVDHAYAQQVNVEKTTVAWDSPSTDPSIPWTDLSGASDTIATFDLALSDTGTDLNVAGSPIASSAVSYADSKINGSWETEVTALLAPQPSGAYLVWCRAVDMSGNKSAWSEPVEVPWDVTPPAPPQNMVVKITLADGTVIELRVTP
jgi:hypothetical protein